MQLTDQQYVLLNALVDFNITDEYLNCRIAEIAAQIRESQENLLKDNSYSLLDELLTQDISSLRLIDRMKVEGAEVCTFNNEDNDMIHIFSYRTDNVLEELSYVLSEDGDILDQATQYLKDHQGKGNGLFTGHSLGGAIAVIAAAAAEFGSGVVFDIPSVAGCLPAEQIEKLEVIHYVSYHNLISALGVPVGTIRYAKQPEVEIDTHPVDESIYYSYHFEKSGAIETSEANDIFQLLAKVNTLLEGNTPQVDIVIESFSEAIGLNTNIFDKNTIVLMLLQEETDSIQISKAMEEVIRRYDQLSNDLFKRWTHEMNSLLDNSTMENMEQNISNAVEHTMLEAAMNYERTYECMEAMISLLIISHVNNLEYIATVEGHLHSFTDMMESRIDQFAAKISEHMDDMINKYLGFTV